MDLLNNNNVKDLGVENTIAIESSTWNNIGDAFYQNSMINIFKSVFPNKNVVSFDGPPNRAFRPRKRKKNVYDARFITEASHYVISGPILGIRFMEEYAPLIKEIIQRGRSYSMLSLHASADGKDLIEILDFLEKFPPTAFHTRDEPTFNKIKEISNVGMNGICFAWFVSKLPGLPDLSLGSPYVCVSYYRNFEPILTNIDGNISSFIDSDIKRVWPKKRTFYEKYWRFFRFLDYKKVVPERLGKWKVIRPVQGFTFHPDLTYSRKNSYISYNPSNFLSIYKYSDGVVTDRVHSGVAGLSFGKPVIVEKVDSRFALFDRVPLKFKNDFMYLEEGALDPFYEKLVNWLSGDYAKASLK